MSEVLVIAIIFGTLFGVTYMAFTTRHKERMALIEQGINPLGIKQKAQPQITYWSLKVGCFLIGISSGMLVSMFLDFIGFNMFVGEAPLGYFAMIMLNGGASLIAYYRIVAKRQKEAEKLMGMDDLDLDL
ncbi:DUF6249 domain-containing protein [Algivirga pacifica]|uniref:DUF6249 domain-containing protein n=1 Tax=Algivirga pacifica TaxID=1162670 RepID=A0ABP9DR98_9BACT